MIIDNVYPNYIFTTVLDVDFDSQQYNWYKKNRVVSRSRLDYNANDNDKDNTDAMKQRPERPPAYLQPSRQLKSTPATPSSRSGADNYLTNRDASGHLQRRRVEVRL